MAGTSHSSRSTADDNVAILNKLSHCQKVIGDAEASLRECQVELLLLTKIISNRCVQSDPTRKPVASKKDNQREVVLQEDTILAPKKRRLSNECSESDFEQAIVYPARMKGYLSPLTEPLICGWRRIVDDESSQLCYICPTGKKMCSLKEIEAYLIGTRDCYLSIDQFSLDPALSLHTKPIPGKYQTAPLFIDDISQGTENKSVICFNTINEEQPQNFTYISSFTRSCCPNIAIVTDRNFMVSCDCNDGCASSSGCVCRKLTETEGRGLVKMGYPLSDGYKYQRLSKPQVSGIFECNQYCGCGPKCSNRVVQRGLQYRIAVFRTEKMGWGVMTLDDIPQGAFLCTYNGLICSDQTGDSRGVTHGDEYLTELDYIEVMEEMKKGYEEDVVSIEGSDYITADDAIETGSELSHVSSPTDKEPNGLEEGQEEELTSPILSSVSSSPSERSKSDSSITSRSFFCVGKTEQDTLSSDFSSSLSSNQISCRHYYENDEGCYIIDSKSQGNVGRFINHSCLPNLFVQNVFIDTHDLRFPWVALFANRNIAAFSEVFWDYSYVKGSVEGRSLMCLCGSSNCRKRLL